MRVSKLNDVAKSRSRKRQSRSRQRGQSLIEAALVMTVFFALLVGVMDIGQVVFAHQSLTERVRAAVRWGSIHQWDGPEAVANYVLYKQPQAPLEAKDGFLGLTRENVRVVHREPSPDRPDDETLTVTIVDFKTQTFTPGFAQVLVSRRPVSFTAPMSRQPDRGPAAADVLPVAR